MNLLLATVGGALLLVSSGSAPATPGQPEVLHDPLSAALYAEFSLIDEHPAAAARAYAAAARQTRRADFAERAARIALYAEDAVTASEMAQLWHELAPGDRGAAQAAAMAHIGRKDPDAAFATLQTLIAGGSQADIEAALRMLAATPRRPGLELLQKLFEAGAFVKLEPGEVSPVPLAVRWKDRVLAKQLAQQAISTHPKAARAWLWLALVQGAEGDRNAAAGSYASALRLAPQNVELRLSYVQLLNELGRQKEIDAILAAAPQTHPGLYAARLALAVSQQQPRQYARLARLIERDQHIDAEERSFLLGQIAELQERKTEALRHYQDIRGESRRADARLRMAVLLFPSDREQALDHLREVQDGGGEHSPLAFRLEAELQQDAGDADAALIALSRGLSLYLDNVELLYARALIHANHEEVELAERDLRRLLELDDDNAAALNALGYTLADRTDRHEEALQLIERALALNPEDAAILDSMGWVLFRLGRVEEALIYLRQAYQAAPDGEIAAHLGEALSSNGERAAAMELWRQQLGKDRSSPVLLQTIQRLAPELLP